MLFSLPRSLLGPYIHSFLCWQVCCPHSSKIRSFSGILGVSIFLTPSIHMSLTSSPSGFSSPSHGDILGQLMTASMLPPPQQPPVVSQGPPGPPAELSTSHTHQALSLRVRAQVHPAKALLCFHPAPGLPSTPWTHRPCSLGQLT